MQKNGLYESLTNDQIELSQNKEDSDDNGRISNTSFHSLEYSPTGEYDTLNEPICTSLVRYKHIILRKGNLLEYGTKLNIQYYQDVFHPKMSA